MSEKTDAELAKGVSEALAKANYAIHEAIDAGLEVHFAIEELHNPAYPRHKQRFTAKVVRPL